MDEMVELADRCEKATADDRRLMFEVGNAIFEPNTDNIGFDSENKARWDYENFLLNEAFLDAAMMLVPEGAWWSVMRTPCADGYDAEVANDDPRHAATPALALCAAALRAQATSRGGEG